MYNLEATVFQRMTLRLLLAETYFCLALPYPIPPSLGSQRYAFSISFSVRFKGASHVPQKKIRGGYSDKTRRNKGLSLPVAFISYVFLLGNYTQKGHLASWQVQEMGGRKQSENKQSL